MNKRVVRRLLETFFRRWWLYLVPVALFGAVGVLKASQTVSGYRAVGIIDVSEGTLLSELTSIRGQNFGYETPAVATARTMNSLIRTDQFMEKVAEEAGVTGALERGEITGLELRQSVYAGADGDTLLQVGAVTDNPELSARLAAATIESFINFTVAEEVSESRAAEAFFDSQAEQYRTSLAQAQAALAEYVAARPGGPLEERPLDQQIEIQRLTDDVSRAQTLLESAQQKAGEARLATEQSTSDVSQRLRMIDEPRVPAAPEPKVQQAALTLVVFLLVGFLLSVGAVIVGSLTDRTVRTAEDVELTLRRPLLAVVPEVARPRRRHRSKQRGQAPSRPAVPAAGSSAGASRARRGDRHASIEVSTAGSTSDAGRSGSSAARVTTSGGRRSSVDLGAGRVSTRSAAGGHTSDRGTGP